MVETIRKHEAPPILSSPEETPTAAYLENILFNTYYFSQGTSDLQKDIMQYIHKIRPTWSVSDEIGSEVFSLNQDRIRRFLTHSQHSPVAAKPNHSVVHPAIEKETDIPEETQTRVEQFKDIVNGNYDNRESVSNLLNRITIRIIKRDFHWLYEKNGRPRRHSNTTSPQTDPWLSHFFYYALEEHSTGIKEFDEMFRGVRNTFTTQGEHLFEGNRDFEMEFDLVSRIYNEKHPKEAKEREVLLFEV